MMTTPVFLGCKNKVKSPSCRSGFVYESITRQLRSFSSIDHDKNGSPTKIDYKYVFHMILRTALTVPIALSIALVIVSILLFIFALVSLLTYVAQLEKNRLFNLAQAEKDGLSVFHSLEYGLKNGVKQHPVFVKSSKQKVLETERNQLNGKQDTDSDDSDSDDFD